MKVRQGFVSNSSSQSFCLIGVRKKYQDSRWVDALLKAENKNYPDNWDEENEPFSGSDSGKVVDFYGCEEPWYAGMDAEDLLQTRSIPQACKYFQVEVLEKLGVEIPLAEIEFMYGEVNTG